MDFITIRTFQNYFTAHIFLTRMKSAGIQCFLKDEFTVTVDPILSNAVGGIKLVVRKEDEAAANNLLNEFDEAYRQSAVCPKCGNKTIELVPKQTTANIATAILTWLFGSYAISVKNVYQCSSCKYESENLTENFEHDSLEYEEENLN
jgi:DNA-directed RNA polymerase subunit M/transcription elongation factor TFIIS